MASKPTFDDIQGCEAALYEWAESYDNKDRARLSKCIAPTLRVDYRSFLNKMWEAMPADEFIEMALDPHVIGHPNLKTQHFVGASRWSKTSDNEITGYHQMRVAHQRYTDDKMTEVFARAHAHGMGTMWYRKVDDVWKFAGVEPDLRWSEGDQSKIFGAGAEKFGENGE